MQRDLAGLERPVFDLVVIGGGIVGAAIARDASRRGLRIALIDMNDFGTAASEAMSRTIHGGLRYLAQGRLGLVREALAERAVWIRTAPDFVSPQPFILPLTRGLSVFKAKTAIALYERLAGTRAQFLTRSEAVTREPVLQAPALSGGVIYHDARVDEPHQLIMALLQDAAQHGAVLANHVECTGLNVSEQQVRGLSARELIYGNAIHIRSASIINATGPWAQRLADALLPGQANARLTVSRGVHIVTKAMTNGHAIALSGRGEHGFVMPWKGMSLIGTTDELCASPQAGSKARPEELWRLKEKIGRLLPAAALFLEQPLGSYAGARALPGHVHNTYGAKRELAICDHGADGARGFLSIYGGKWTTARRNAEIVVDRLASHIDRVLGACDTQAAQISAPLEAGTLKGAVERAVKDEMAVTSEDVWRRLGRHASFWEQATRMQVDGLVAAMRLPASMARTEELEK